MQEMVKNMVIFKYSIIPSEVICLLYFWDIRLKRTYKIVIMLPRISVQQTSDALP